MIMVALLHKKLRNCFAILISLLLLWEIVEISFTCIAISMFDPEILPDQFTDIVIGTAGGLLGMAVFRYRQGTIKLYNISPGLLMECFVAFTMSFLWVGSYGYAYNVPFYNSPGINWLAFTLWSVGLLATMWMYRLIIRVVKSALLSILVTWALYFLFLLLLEYIGYYFLGIRLMTSEGPLVLGLIHGTDTLKAYYITAGICAIFLNKLLTKACRSGRMRFPSSFAGKMPRSFWKGVKEGARRVGPSE